MANDIIKRDDNRVTTLAGIDSVSGEIRNLLVDPITGALQVTGTVTLSLDIQNEGSSLTTEPASIDFVGTGVTATAVGDAVTVTISALADPMTTRGDIIVRNAANATARLAVGAANSVLGSDGTDVAWAGATGTGDVVRATSPALVTPNLGTPSAGTLTNCTFPTLNQNTSGTAAGLSGTPSITVNTVTTTGNIELGNASDTTLSRSAAGVIAVEGVVIPSISSTNTLTNKRITKRVASVADDATAVIDCDSYDDYYLTAMANATEISVSGTPTNGQEIFIALKDDGTTRGLTWTGITALGVTLPATTTVSKQHIIKIKYITSAWFAIAASVAA